MTINTVSREILERSMGFKVSDGVSSRLQRASLEYRDLSVEEFNQYVLKYLKTLDLDLKTAGEHRLGDWESGWGENLKEYKVSKNLAALTPKYHSRSNISKLDTKMVKVYDREFDFKLHSFFLDSLLDKYSEGFDHIYEFGCGTGYHLFRLSDRVAGKKLTGLDWSKSSQDIFDEVSKQKNPNTLEGLNFDYFKPDYNINVRDSFVYTVASLEQIGSRHDLFIDYLLHQKPALCMHMEPISEVFDENNILDYLNMKYFSKRGYLKGFLTKLKSLEKEGKVSIINERRLNYGSEFVEGHTLVIWKPL